MSYSAAWKIFCVSGLAKTRRQRGQIRKRNRVDEIVRCGCRELNEADALAIRVQAVGFGVDRDGVVGAERLHECLEGVRVGDVDRRVHGFVMGDTADGAAPMVTRYGRAPPTTRLKRGQRR